MADASPLEGPMALLPVGLRLVLCPGRGLELMALWLRQAIPVAEFVPCLGLWAKTLLGKLRGLRCGSWWPFGAWSFCHSTLLREVHCV